MKKILLFGALVLSYGTFAQNTAVEQDSEAKFFAGPRAKPLADNNANRAVPFYTEDFQNGFPAGWTIQDTSGICPWVYSTDGSWGNFNGNGATAGAAGINSTTAANGFLICDIDSANHFTYGQPSGANYQYLSTYVTTDAINCSTHASVILNFEQFYRYNNGVAMNVKVSNDGVNWTTYNVSGGIANNANSANPASVTLNISSVAANQSTVYLRFGWSARVYYWMIDDITLSEADPFDIAMVDSWWGMGTVNYQNYKTPLSHAAPISFYSNVSNNTGSQLDGCAVDVDVVGTAGSVFSGTSNVISLPASVNDTVTSTTGWTPTAIGFYDVSFSASTTSGVDANMANNNFADSLEITTSTFGLDNLSSPSQSTGSISNFSSNTGLPFKIGNIYQVTVDDVVECVHVGIANNAASDGKEIFAEVYAFDPISGDFVLRGASAYYTLTTADVGDIITLPLIQPGDVYADEEILVVVGHTGGAATGADDVAFMYGQQVPEQTVYGYNAVGDLFYLASPRAIVIRPDFSCGLGLNDADQIIDATVFPNPTNNQFTVRLGEQMTNGTITLLDLNGRVVLTKEVSASGLEISIDVAHLANGMYTLHVKSEKGVKSMQVEITH